MTDHKRLRWMTLGWAGFGLALFVVTYRLWNNATAEFPHIPLFAIGRRLPPALDVFGFGILLLTLLAVLTSRSPSKVADDGRQLGIGTRWTQFMTGLHVVVLIVMVIANQHRLQPWAYLSAIIGCVLACCQPKRAVSLLRIVLIGVYLHSAISKFDYEFAHGMGQSFLRTLTQPIGVQTDNWSATTRVFASLVFPLTELLVAIGLIFQSTRHFTVWLAVIMHGTLLIVLGPWGMGQQPAVLIWNAFFIWIVIALFGWSASEPATTDEDGDRENEPRRTQSNQRKTMSFVATMVVAAVLILPLLEPIQRFDHWPSWGLYAPRNSRAVVFVEAAGVEKLPESFQSAIAPTRFEDPEFATTASRLSLNQVSLESLRVPLYPQDRYQIGVALAIAERYELGEFIHVEHQGVASRRYGDRERKMIDGVDELRAFADRYRLNARPRDRPTP